MRLLTTMLVVDMAMEVCFEVAAPNIEVPTGNDSGSQITSWFMVVSSIVHRLLLLSRFRLIWREKQLSQAWCTARVDSCIKQNIMRLVESWSQITSFYVSQPFATNLFQRCNQHFPRPINIQSSLMSFTAKFTYRHCS
jgi:hypothetical protein